MEEPGQGVISLRSWVHLWLEFLRFKAVKICFVEFISIVDLAGIRFAQSLERIVYKRCTSLQKTLGRWNWLKAYVQIAFVVCDASSKVLEWFKWGKLSNVFVNKLVLSSLSTAPAQRRSERTLRKWSICYFDVLLKISMLCRWTNAHCNLTLDSIPSIVRWNVQEPFSRGHVDDGI